MSPSREVITRFPFTPTQWMAGSPTNQEEVSPATFPNGVDIAAKVESQDGDRFVAKERNGELVNTLSDRESVTSDLINAQRYFSQMYGLQQQAEVVNRVAANNQRNTQVEITQQTPDNYSSSDKEKMKNFLQTLATSSGNNNLLFSYGGQLPWTTASLAAIAANQQLSTTASNPAASLYAINQTNHKNSSVIVPVLGNLLPPPPSLPLAVSSMQSKSCSASHPAYSSMPTTTSKSANYSSLSNDSGSRFHTSVNILQHANITSLKDRSQPLDLSLIKRQRLENAANEKNQNGVAVNPVQEASSSSYSVTAPTLNMTSHINLPRTINPPSFNSSSNTSSPTLDDAIAQQKQHLASTSNFLQNYQSISSPQSDGRGNFTDFTRDCLQKWLIAAQQRQQAVAAQHSTKQQRKRPISGEYSADLKRKRCSDDLSNKIPKPRVLLANNHGVAQSPRVTGAVPTNNNGKRYKRYAKPPYSYVALITLAILSASEKKLRLSQILKRISEMFPFFKGQYQGWRDSVRHNLSQNECFVKVLKNPYRPTAKGNYWTVTTSTIPRDLMSRQNTLVSRYVQDSGYNYRKDLTEVFDCISGNMKVKIPQHLLNGTDLVDDPAAVMEALLLELKGENDSLNVPSNVASPPGRTYSLVDLFDQDDAIDEDIGKRQAYGTANSKWLDKPAKSRRNSLPSKPIPVVSMSNQILPMHNAVSAYVDNSESQKIVEMLRNASKLMNPLNASQTNSQNGLLSQAMSAATQASALPLFLNMCNNAKKFHQQANVVTQKRTSLDTDSSPEIRDKPFSPPQGMNRPMPLHLYGQFSTTPTSIEQTWTQRNEKTSPFSSSSPPNFEMHSTDESQNDKCIEKPGLQQTHLYGEDREPTVGTNGKNIGFPHVMERDSKSPVVIGQNSRSPVVIGQNSRSPVVIGQNSVSPVVIGQNSVLPVTIAQESGSLVGNMEESGSPIRRGEDSESSSF